MRSPHAFYALISKKVLHPSLGSHPLHLSSAPSSSALRVEAPHDLPVATSCGAPIRIPSHAHGTVSNMCQTFLQFPVHDAGHPTIDLVSSCVFSFQLASHSHLVRTPRTNEHRAPCMQNGRADKQLHAMSLSSPTGSLS